MSFIACDVSHSCLLSDEEEDDEMDFSGVKSVNLQVCYYSAHLSASPATCIHSTSMISLSLSWCVCVCVG